MVGMYCMNSPIHLTRLFELKLFKSRRMGEVHRVNLKGLENNEGGNCEECSYYLRCSFIHCSISIDLPQSALINSWRVLAA